MKTSSSFENVAKSHKQKSESDKQLQTSSAIHLEYLRTSILKNSKPLRSSRSLEHNADLPIGKTEVRRRTRASSSIQFGRVRNKDAGRLFEDLIFPSLSSKQEKIKHLKQKLLQMKDNKIKREIEVSKLYKQFEATLKARDAEIDLLKKTSKEREKNDVDIIIRLESEIMQLRKQNDHFKEDSSISSEKARKAMQKAVVVSQENHAILDDVAYLSELVSVLKEKTCIHRCAHCVESNLKLKGLAERISAFSMEQDSAIEVKHDWRGICNQNTERLKICLQEQKEEIRRLKDEIKCLVKKNRESLESRMGIVKDLNQMSGNYSKVEINQFIQTSNQENEKVSSERDDKEDSDEDSTVEVVCKVQQGQPWTNYDKQLGAVFDTNSCACVCNEIAGTSSNDASHTGSVYHTRSCLMLKAFNVDVLSEESDGSSDVEVVYKVEPGLSTPDFQ